MSIKIVQASLLVALSGILYGFLGVLGTHILQESISIPAMLFWRFFIAGCAMLVFVIFKNSQKKISFSVDKMTLFYMFLLGAFGYATSSALYFAASRYTGTGLAMVIFFSYPIIVALFSIVFHRKGMTKGTLLTLFLICLGLFLMKQSPDNAFSMLGIFFAVASAICYAIYVFGSKHLSALHLDANVLTTFVCFGCAFILLLYTLFTHTFAVPHTLHNWIYLITFGVVVTALPIQLMLQGLKVISSMRASIISVLEPLVTVFLGILILHENISHMQLLGALIILASALFVQFQKEL